MLRRHAALVSRKRTRVTSGVNLPLAEIIMSRRMSLETRQMHFTIAVFVVSMMSLSAVSAQQPSNAEVPKPKAGSAVDAIDPGSINAKDIIAGLAFIVSAISLTISILQRRRERVEAVIEGLRGDRRAVAYAAHTIRLSRLLGRNDHR